MTEIQLEVLGWLYTAHRTAKQNARTIEAIPFLSLVDLRLLGATAPAANLSEMGYAEMEEVSGTYRLTVLGEYAYRDEVTA